VAVGGQGNCADSKRDHPSLLLIFDPSVAENQTLWFTKEPMKLFLVHTMMFAGSTWKNKSG
jgi:hypothetical protein